MNQQPAVHPDYESFQSILNSIAQWMTKYRNARGIYNDLANCGRRGGRQNGTRSKGTSE